MSAALRDLLPRTYGELRATLSAGHPIDPAALDDTEYHGIALGNPAWFERVTWKTFKKVFRRDPATGVLRGWNVAVEQRGPEGPFDDRRRRGERVVYWPYEVHAASGYRMPGPWGFGLCIDYGRAHPWWNPQHLIRDPLVAVNAGSADLLLGYSYVDLGFLQLGTPSYFALVRGGPLTYDAFGR